MKRALLLNADWTPLNFVSDIRALTLLFKGRAEVITLGEKPSFWDERINSASSNYEVPATIRLFERINRRYSTPRFRKKILFNRDNWQCQYCGVKLDWSSVTIDHVVPRCKGGQTTWKNCVASCVKCNMKKGPRQLSESGMQLKKNPTEPHITHYWEFNQPSAWHEDWNSFFSSK